MNSDFILLDSLNKIADKLDRIADVLEEMNEAK